MSVGVTRIDAAIDQFISKRLYDVHSQINAKVIAVNLGSEIPTVDLEILWEGTSQENPTLNYKYPNILDVPVMMLAVSPSIKITVPIKVGTLGIVQFPEKPLYGFNGKDKVSVVITSEKTSFPLQGLAFYPSYNCGLIDADNIIIQNENSIIKIKNGEIEISAPSSVKINGATVTPDGDFVTAAGVSLNNVKTVYNSHKHGGGPLPDPLL